MWIGSCSRSSRVSSRQRPVSRCERDELALARPRHGDHDDVGHRRVFPDHRFDLAEFHAAAPDLDLVVHAAEVLGAAYRWPWPDAQCRPGSPRRSSRPFRCR
ncbi:hypothetical protein AOZ06_23545 [Kibdelosporangium phytohabitans]|uniref:Uncharacterized protein n=1 Tax=Kibdelosporangium phytohabitans TaxID=860235 RepID=A0A0N9I3V9_9PSEU|nr:hypothetical protein AOZ06_23545 [Kibdelosporangium phytohabitans]